jgi:ribose 5-phosphate isomerase B
MRIAIASDHAAIDLKAQLADWLREQGHEVNDLGPHDGASVDYPDYGYALASGVADGAAERGVALCGSGIGISIAVNREHNDANVIALGARLTGPDMAKACVSAFLSTEFGGGRHQRRVDKLTNPSL